MPSTTVKADTVLEVGQRVEFYMDDDPATYSSRIEDIIDKKLIVAMPMDSRRVPIIPAVGTKLYGKIITKTCAYRFFSVYRDKASTPIPVWHIDKPEKVERFQNRGFVRVRVSVPVKYQLVNEDGSLQDAVESRTIDMSGSGLSFWCKERVQVGMKTAVHINNIPGVGQLQFMTEVAQCRELKTDSVRIYYVGVKIQNMERAIQNRIVKYLFQVERANLAKGLGSD